MAMRYGGASLCRLVQRPSFCISFLSGNCCRGPVLCTSHCIALKNHPEARSLAAANLWPLSRFYRASFRRRKSDKKLGAGVAPGDDSSNIDDLKSLLHDNSLSLSAKIKVLFKQYGAVLIVVHLFTAAFWIGIFYFAVSRGFDIVPFMEKYGVFNFLERIGLPASEKLKSPGASNALAAYLLYEVAKPIRYPTTIVCTIYSVRFLRRLNYLKRPPKTDATVRDLVQTQGKIVRHHIQSTKSKYQERYRSRARQTTRKNGHHHPKGGRKH